MKLAASRSVLASVAVGFLALPTTAQQQKSEMDQLAEAISRDLSIDAWETPNIEITPIDDQDLFAEMTIHGEEYWLELEPFNIRSPNFSVVVFDEEGVPEFLEAPAPNTYRGIARGPRGDIGAVRVAVENGSMEGTIFWNHTDSFTTIQPLSEFSHTALASEHIVYDSQDIRPHDGICGTDIYGTPIEPGHVHDSGNGPTIAPSTRGDVFRYDVMEIAIDADSLYFAQNGNDVDRTLKDIESVMGVVDEIYRRDVDIGFEITVIILRMTAGTDPYDAPANRNASTLLGRFRGIWNNSNREERKIRRDLAHLFTGHNLNGSTIGIATLGVVCSKTSGFGLSQSRFTTNLAARASLTAHELGHNWSAPHCNGLGNNRCHIMCDSTGGCGGNISRFGQQTQNTIRNHLASKACLEPYYGRQFPPFYDGFEAGELDSRMWTYRDGHQVNKLADAEPSGIYSVRFAAAGDGPFDYDEIRSNRINLEPLRETHNGDVYLTFFGSVLGFNEGDVLRVEYFRDNSLWKPLVGLHPEDNDLGFQFYKIQIPQKGLWKNFRVRFWTDVDGNSDRAFIDDVQVSVGGVHHTVEPLVRGETAEFRAWGLKNTTEPVYLLYSFAGLGEEGPCVGGPGVSCLQLNSPAHILTIALPVDGEIRVPMYVPLDYPENMPIYTQFAATYRGRPFSRMSNAVESLPE